jgi:hypothetical protein
MWSEILVILIGSENELEDDEILNFIRKLNLENYN